MMDYEGLADSLSGMHYRRLIEILNGSFDVVRRGEDGPYLAENTLAALGIVEDGS